MKTLIRFLRDKRAVSPVIGTILMVAITVVMAAIVGTFVYQTGKPKASPTMSTTLEDDVRVILTNVTTGTGATGAGRIAKLLVEGGARLSPQELLVVVTYTNQADPSVEQTVTLDGTGWAAGQVKTMGAVNITLKWVDSDNSGDISPGDRLDFAEGTLVNGEPGTAEAKAGTDFEVKLTHKSSEATLASHTIRVY